MTLTIDKAGRVILPKPVRERFGLHAGSELEMQETTEGVLLTPGDRKPALVRKGRFVVYNGELPAGYDILKAIEQDRDDRNRKSWGS